MSIITIDFETYYDKDFSLSKLTTEEYVNDPRFEVIGMGIKIDEGRTQWVTEDIDGVLKMFDWSEHAILCHNTLFDGAILAWKYKVKPGFWMDTLSMARALHGVDAGGSLKALAERYQIGEKGDEVIHALGKRLSDFGTADLARYGDYCRNDVDLTYSLFSRLSDGFPDNELRLIDLTVRMLTQPVLMVDSEILQERLNTIENEKLNLLSDLELKLNCNDAEEVRAKLASNKQFAEVLGVYGVKPPTKISATTGKETYAFAKTDQGFLDLQEHPDPFIQQLCTVRLGTKSTIEESRIERFIGIGSRNRGHLPIPLKYYGAHTGRWAGLDAVNFQNLPSRDRQKKALKNSIVAPDGYLIVNCDSSQIEARVLAWLAGQTDVCSQFANGEDVYCHDATKAFGRRITRADPVERFVGKTMRLGLGYGTGHLKLHSVLKLGGADLSEDKCKELVMAWRQNNPKIVELWREADRVLNALLSWPVDDEGREGSPFCLGNTCVMVDRTGIRLPNNLYIRYPEIQMEGEQIIYKSRKGPVKLWGGVVVENVVQALARIVVGEQMLALADAGYRPVLTVHDAAVCIVQEDEIKEGIETITRIMSTAPDWAANLPVACEAKCGNSYGEC